MWIRRTKKVSILFPLLILQRLSISKYQIAHLSVPPVGFGLFFLVSFNILMYASKAYSSRCFITRELNSYGLKAPWAVAKDCFVGYFCRSRRRLSMRGFNLSGIRCRYLAFNIL